MIPLKNETKRLWRKNYRTLLLQLKFERVLKNERVPEYEVLTVIIISLESLHSVL